MRCDARFQRAQANLRIASMSAGIRLCSGNAIIKLHGLNWFGFETGATFVDGLWQGPTSLTLDFMTNVRRIKLLGFNTIRLPMSLKVGADEAAVMPRQMAHHKLPGSVLLLCTDCASEAACINKVVSWNVTWLASSCEPCLQSLFEDRPRDYRTNCPQSGHNAGASTIYDNVKKPGLKSAPPTCVPHALLAVSLILDHHMRTCSALVWSSVCNSAVC